MVFVIGTKGLECMPCLLDVKGALLITLESAMAAFNGAGSVTSGIAW